MKYHNVHKLFDSISASFDARIFLVNIYIINNLIKQNKTIRVPFDGNLSFTRVHVIFKMVKKGEGLKEEPITRPTKKKCSLL